MKVILTHEQADFDAIASLLAASLLVEKAIPVLPHKVNRNVRAFLNLYGVSFPFREFDELPKEPVESIFLVDTQSLVTLKGISSESRVQVIDHHNARPDHPPSWEIRSDRVGATTTLLVEDLIARGEIRDPLAATLLLLGIYEDTGSFQYSSTTSRDIRACAYLLENGASLKTAADFLNPPLSASQRDLYELLLSVARTTDIHGSSVTVASAILPEMEDEISSVAHKLRDLLDPDGLFLIVATREGIRLVARSSSDRIDVAAVMQRFGGGGHERAAAALMSSSATQRDEDLESRLDDVQKELHNILEQTIQPATTASQFMSRRPMTLKPTTSLEEASTLMQRYGYEGFPVVSGSQVVGLLTRRNVDRAIVHKLGVNAAEIMQPGEVFVKPTDSISTVQKTMEETGWGQIPVFDPGKEKVVGIITRTDLLRILASDGKTPPPKRNLGSKLESYLSRPTLMLLRLISEQAVTLGYPVFLVGGIVRDLILERAGADLDLVVEGDAIQLAKLLVEKFGGRQVSHTRFGTAKWFLADNRGRHATLPGIATANSPGDFPARLDLISSRTEYYEYPTALPIIERGSIKLDLFRRDFTINTLAIRLDGDHFGELHDFWGGYDDLQQGLIRVLHPLSFVDDPTRLLRAVRFEQRFSFTIEDRTLKLMERASHLLSQVSGQRARHELDLYLLEPQFAGMFSRASSLGLLSSIHPGLECGSRELAAIQRFTTERIDPEWGFSAALFSLPLKTSLTYLGWFCVLEEHAAITVANRLRLPAGFTGSIRQVFRNRSVIPRLTGQSVSRTVAHLDKVSLPALFILDQAATEDEHLVIWNYLTQWRHIKPASDGETLRSMGIPPGPIYKKLLGAIRAALLDGEIHSPAEERQLLGQLAKQITP